MRIPIKGLGDVGWIADQEGYELASNAITDLQNMRLRNGWAERVRGHRQIAGDLTFPAYHLASYAGNDTKYLIEAGLRTVQCDDGATRTDISAAAAMTMNSGHKWTSTFFGGLQILNNQADAPYYWNGLTSGDLTPLSAWPSGYRAKAVRTIKYHVVALNITKSGVENPNLILISSPAQPGSQPSSFDAADPAQPDADEIPVKGDGVLVDALPMGESLIMYSERSLSMLRYSPSNDSSWFCELLPFDFGMLSQNCGVSVPGIGHVVLTQGDVVRFDGTSVQSILQARARDWLFAQMDVNWFRNSFVVANVQKSEVWICFPESGNEACTKALVWNYRSDKLSKRDLPNVLCGCSAAFNYAVDTFDSDSVTFDSESTLTFDSGNETVTANDARLFLGTSAKEVFLMDSSDQADGQAFTSYIERTGLNDLGEGYEGLIDHMKHLSRIWLNVDAPVGTQLSVYVGAADDPETAPTYQAPVTFTVGTDQYVDPWTCGRQLAYKIENTGSARWRIRSLTLEVEDGGEF